MVTAIVNNPGLVVGMVLDWTNAKTYRVKKGSGIITRGDLLVPDTGTSPDSWKISPASRNAGPFAMCLQTVASAATEMSIVRGGIWAVMADGTIEINKLVQSATGTAGQVIQYAAPTGFAGATPTAAEVAAAGSEFTFAVGVCLGFADNYNTTSPTAPVDGDLVAVDTGKVV